MEKPIWQHASILALFAIITTGLTAFVYHWTRPTIDQQIIDQQQRLFDEILPRHYYDNALLSSCYLVTDSALGDQQPHRLYVARKNQQITAGIIETTAPDGYSGDIKLLLATNFKQRVFGSRVLDEHETPGLGDKIEESITHWIESFTDKHIDGYDDPRWAVKKDGGQFDQFTGATITPRAVVNSIKRTAIYMQSLPARLDRLPRCPAEDPHG